MVSSRHFIFFFFMNQVAKLCFKNVDGLQVPNPLIYSLLCSIKAQCTQDDLQQAIDTAFQDLAEIETPNPTKALDMDVNDGNVHKYTHTHACTHAQTHAHTHSDSTLMHTHIQCLFIFFRLTEDSTISPDVSEKVLAFIEYMSDAGISEKLAFMALQSDEVDGPEDTSGGRCTG